MHHREEFKQLVEELNEAIAASDPDAIKPGGANKPPKGITRRIHMNLTMKPVLETTEQHNVRIPGSFKGESITTRTGQGPRFRCQCDSHR